MQIGCRLSAAEKHSDRAAVYCFEGQIPGSQHTSVVSQSSRSDLNGFKAGCQQGLRFPANPAKSK